MNWDLFVSYARADLSDVEHFVTRLKAQGLSLWMDKHGIDGSSRWRAEIVSAIEHCKAVLLLLSEHSVQSDNVARELTLAGEEGRPVVPLMLDPVEIPRSMRYELAGVQYNETRRQQSDDGLARVLRALQRHSITAAPPAAAATSQRHVLLPCRCGSVHRIPDPGETGAFQCEQTGQVLRYAARCGDVPCLRGPNVEIPLRQGVVVLGRSCGRPELEGNVTLSREHCRLYRGSRGFYVEDLASTNGTFVNEEPLTPHEGVLLRPGDLVRLGGDLFLRYTEPQANP